MSFMWSHLFECMVIYSYSVNFTHAQQKAVISAAAPTAVCMFKMNEYIMNQFSKPCF